MPYITLTSSMRTARGTTSVLKFNTDKIEVFRPEGTGTSIKTSSGQWFLIKENIREVEERLLSVQEVRAKS
jgi:uncharacterized protein YlzI (FlbEa/FlbD family)